MFTPAEAENEILRNVPPHSVSAEQGVLGGVLFKSDSLFNIQEILEPEDFYLPAHQILYASFLEMSEKRLPLDLVSVGEFLKETARLEDIGGAVYLAELAHGVVSVANAEYLAGIVRDKSKLRALIAACSTIISQCFTPGVDTGEVVDESEKSVLAVAERGASRTYKDAKQLAWEVFSELEEKSKLRESVTGVNTGYADMNRMTAGFQKSDLIIIAARPAVGKTAFALNLAMRAAITHDVPTAVFSLEMSSQQLMQRLLCAWGRVDLSRLRGNSLREEDWMKLQQAAGDLSQAPMYIDDTPALSVLDLRSRCRRLKMERNLGIVFVDYLQLMRGTSRQAQNSRELEISEISRGLKALAKELNIPVIALAQLNRKVEERSDKTPILSDLRESGAIEQDADIIMFIHRDAAYLPKETAPPPQDQANIIIGKQRNGPTGKVDLLYTRSYTRFDDMIQSPEWPLGM